MSNYAITQLPFSHGKVLRETKTRLATTVSSTPSLDAQVLLAHITGKPRTWLLAHPEALLSPHEFQQIEEALQKLEAGFPLPYLLGEREFFGLKFKVTPDTLIPRPETELLVETALAWLKQLPSPTERGTKGEGIYAADIGTGTGCIAVSLAAHCPELHVVATDLCPAALAVAQHNAEIHYVSDRITFLEADLLSFHSFGQRLKIAAQDRSSVIHYPLPITNYTLITANLPYIPTATLYTLEVYRHEPTLALDGGLDGLALIRPLLFQAATCLAPGGLVLLEIEATQGKAAQELARQHFPQAHIEIRPDLARHDRLLVIRTSSTD